MKATTPPRRCASARMCWQSVVLPDDSGPRIAASTARLRSPAARSFVFSTPFLSPPAVMPAPVIVIAWVLLLGWTEGRVVGLLLARLRFLPARLACGASAPPLGAGSRGGAGA